MRLRNHEVKFWQDVFLAAMKAGHPASPEADRAIRLFRERMPDPEFAKFQSNSTVIVDGKTGTITERNELSKFIVVHFPNTNLPLQLWLNYDGVWEDEDGAPSTVEQINIPVEPTF